MEQLKILRKQKGLYQKDVATFLGVDRTTYVKYENGVSEPDNDTLVKLAELFNVSVDYLLGRETNDIYASIGAMPVKKIKLPVLGNVACGEPIYANEGLEGYV